MGKGYIYVLSNPSMTGLLKIGLTLRTVEERVIELSNNTGVPTQFQIEAYFESEIPENDEGKIHEALKDFRVSYKEFFKIKTETAIGIIGNILSKQPIYIKEQNSEIKQIEGNRKYHNIVTQYKRQIKTGYSTEKMVREKLETLGFTVRKPKYDDGVDFEVYKVENPKKIVKVQVKGRNIQLSSDRNRWFQIRTSPSQRRKAELNGISAADAYKEKVSKCDFFILVSVKHDEMWVFSQQEILELIELNKSVHGNRPDNVRGEQKEMELDIVVNGISLTKVFELNLNNFNPIIDMLKS